jgi:hypothetical protein
VLHAALIFVAMMPGGSSTWQEFKKLEDGGKLKAECMWCHVKLKGEAKYGTTHLYAHLKRCQSRHQHVVYFMQL